MPLRAGAAALVLALCSTAHAQYEWTPVQTGLAVSAVALRVVDYGQTMDLVRRGPSMRLHERNPLIGKHPSRGDVNRYFLISTALMGAAAHYLPEWRSVLLSLYVMNGVYYAGSNYNIGLKVDF